MKYITQSLLYRNKDLRCLYLGQFISFTGTMMTGIVLPYQIYHETHSTLLVGLLGFFQLLPLLVTALVGGVMADRYHRRRLLIITEILLALGCLVLAYNATFAVPSIIAIFVTATLMSGINGFHRPALESMAQQILTKPDFPAYSALSTFKYSFAMIVGPALGGIILARYGVTITFLIDFASFVISLFFILKVHYSYKPQHKPDFSTWASLKEGVQYAMSRQELVGSYVVDFVAMIFGMPNALFPAIAEGYGGAKVLGMLYAAPAVGALLISFWGGWARYFKRHGAGIAVSATFWGIAILCFGLMHHLSWALFFLVMAGGADAVSGIFRSTLWNQTIEPEYRGRLSGIEMISYLSGPKLGDTEAGLIASAFGVTTSIVSGGVLCIVSVLACCYWLPHFWRYRSSD